MAEPGLGGVEKLAEFFATAQIEACARRTGFVRRASKITGKVFLALVTVGSWSTRTTSLGQLAAKAAQLPTPVDISPEALHQRMTRRAVAFLMSKLPSLDEGASCRGEDAGRGFRSPLARSGLASRGGAFAGARNSLSRNRWPERGWSRPVLLICSPRPRA